MVACDVIVIGAGVMGSATAYHLAKRGHRVVLLEQFATGHEYGSSHGHSRIFRLVYDLPEYVALARAALPLWRELEADTGEELLLQTGGIDFAEPANQAMHDTHATLIASGVPFESLDSIAIRQRFPQFAVSEQAVGFYQADSGILDAGKCVLAMIGAARARQAVLYEHAQAQQIHIRGTGVEVRTTNATYSADRLVVTAGSWARPLLQQIELHLPLTVTKEQFAFFAPHDPALFMPERCPIFIQHMQSGPSVYGFPCFGLPGVKIAFHNDGAQIQPEETDRSVDPDRMAALQAHITRWLPQAAGKTLLTQTCRYTSTPDHEFIVDLHPHYPQIVIGSPCSGHGFKFGVLIGSILADLVESGTTSHAIERFRLSRFAQASKFA
jgi:monomeric sarcosine oxidase